MKFAFFDVDNTIYNGYSASDIVLHFVAEGIADISIKHRMSKAENDYFKGHITYSEIAQIALDLVSESYKNLNLSNAKVLTTNMLNSKKKVLNDWVSIVLDYLRKNDYKLILVSAGPDTIVSQVAERYGFDKWFATHIPHSSEIYTGSKTTLINDEKKENILEDYHKNSEFMIGFGDSTGDIPLLENVDVPFVASNDHHGKMIDHAKKNNWTIFRDADEVISKLESLVK